MLRRGWQENITIFNLTAFVLFKSFLTTKSVDFVEVSSGYVEDRFPRIFCFLCFPQDKSLSLYWVAGVEKSISYMADRG